MPAERQSRIRPVIARTLLASSTLLTCAIRTATSYAGFIASRGNEPTEAATAPRTPFDAAGDGNQICSQFAACLAPPDIPAGRLDRLAAGVGLSPPSGSGLRG